MKSITVVGTWREKKVKTCKHIAQELGKLIAEKNYAFISGGGTGLSKTVVESYRKHGGKKYITYRPALKFVRKVGEKLGPKPDKLIRIKGNYPEQNVTLVRNSQAIIAMHGGLGTLAEIIFAIKDYKIPVAVIHFGDFVKHIKAIPELRKNVFIAKTAKKAIDFIETKIG